ncbi:Transposase [Alicyclobacillus hesperidum]|uniref:Transposase n=4 Tax=Alicyclobacillus hesperidum TaxID=89784 RepID=A0A1H2YNB1_9BACL|nr:IS110 family transposase [Alicyclobacillus hesperidum]SDX06732.1 Transposase [Alicyclobacillus hesperidum]
MYFIGIDIGKRQHEACIIDSSGQIQSKMFRFSNTQAGGQKLIEWMRAVDPNLASFCVGMEATGHYWLALYTFLCKQGIRPLVINPIQSDAFRNMYIRQAKNDAKDAFIIAEILRFGRYTTTELANEQILALRQLSRFRFNLVDSISDLKRQVIGILDILFPEYERLFSDLFGKTSSELLMEYTTPEEILAVDTEELAAFIAKHSRNRFGLDKAQELKSAAESSFGVGIALDAYRLQLRLLLQQIRFMEQQLRALEDKITTYLAAVDTNLMTIPGIGPVLAAAILGEIGDISRFSTGVKLVAYAGIDPTVKQSGEYTGTRNRMSKRGSPYLRRAIWLAASVAKTHNPILKAFYEQKRAEGKHPLAATGAVARKLTYVIHAVLRDRKPYEPIA